MPVRIPSVVAKSVGFKVGQPVEVSAQDSAVLVTAIGEPRLTLARKLALFDTNPFAVKFRGPKGMSNYVLGHQPQSFDWRAREAKPHPWKQVPEDVFAIACETLNQIITIGN